MRNYRVCVVDDHEDTAQVLCEGLRLNGYEAVAASTGAEALEICRRGGVDLLLLDVCLPDIGGYSVCERLKQSKGTRDIAVIFVTVRGSKADIATGFRLGAVDYITKPYNLPMVMVRVEAVLQKRTREDLARGDEDLLTDSAYTDCLTGLRNGPYFLDRLEEEVEKAHRYDYPVSCAVFDIDDVRPVDQELGSVSLDDLLVEIAIALRDYSRGYDVLARYDGTLFAAMLPHTPLEQAVRYATKIMSEVDATTFSDPSFPTQASLSTGIACCQNGMAHGAEFMFGEAMRSLLQAKSLSGRRLVARNLNAE